MIEELYVNRFLNYLEEDAYPEDITSRFLEGIRARGIIKSRDEGIIAGLRFMIPFLKYLGFEVITYKHDSDVIRKGDVIMEIIGDGGRLLAVERLTLNLLSRLSGIATATNTMVRLARSVNPTVRIAGTRKTTPGFRAFEKYAIEIGGGDPHRFNLADAVLIKDNHIAVYGDLEGLIKLIKGRTSFTKKVEVEVSTYEDAIRAYRAGADAILLDNMRPSDIVPVVRELKGRVILEASGGITPDNVIEYARTGIDVISSGYITHSARSLDLTMDAERI
ncbi:carboxylating nicotinate-nucleotide diphosphorylase [Vulcanisaeta souniana]|uniref:Nicotinate-nucleotide pyrophosphorylase [carboxylating] n=2 Tax=Vulcanisaeta souniana TaxID=164452 RepID=A0A830EAA6_9CREN|nr:carboxylating nicotinate-nucleotide diphosphorylase [Vulcanisaeta souniana]BDR90975.1 nicotinate-nucleotide diphosphorylase (carboxylating) [Vulcanisaeta souniana JCM 11219]GGI79726.1 nicotinate-nucleotide diphosphorylase (carboxylating) [Vulcanisaeta souniana JCM 11219]